MFTISLLLDAYAYRGWKEVLTTAYAMIQGRGTGKNINFLGKYYMDDRRSVELWGTYCGFGWPVTAQFSTTSSPEMK